MVSDDDPYNSVSREELDAELEHSALMYEEEQRRQKEAEKERDEKRHAELRAQYEEMLELLKQKNVEDRQSFEHSISRRKINSLIVAVCSFSLGYLLVQMFSPQILDVVFSRYQLWVPLVLVVVCSGLFLYMRGQEQFARSFVAIDKSAELKKETIRLEERIRGLDLALNQTAFAYSGKDMKAVLSAESRASNAQTSELGKFEGYLQRLIDSYDEQIAQYDKKASNLLDKGIQYLVTGIVCYVGSIIIWQVVVAKGYVGDFYVVGMISCALTFLVVEFLAAWFLRQYKGFVDASLGLERVKSVFNRYLLSYYAVSEFGDKSTELAHLRGEVLKVLKEPVKWMDAPAPKPGDLNHMVAMFESVAGVLGKLKVGAKKKVSDDAEK